MNVTLGGPIRDLFDVVEAATVDSTPDLARIGDALSSVARDRSFLEPWIERLGERSGAVAIHAPSRGPRLMLVHRLHGQMSAIHDHGTWVAISPVRGTETHRRWRVARDTNGPVPAAPRVARDADGVAPASPRVELADDAFLSGAEVATLLPPDDVHDHGHLVGRGEPAHVLILLGDDQTQFTRNEWDAATGRHRVLVPGDGGRWVSSDPIPGADAAER